MPPLRFQRLLTVPPLLLLLGSLASADAITGRVVNASGVGVAGVDIDFVSLGGGGNPHELNDGTDANGNFLTTLDPGVYDVLFFPPAPPVTSLLAGIRTPVVVSGTVDLGTITLVAGFALSGTVHNAASQPVANVRIDVYRENTGALVLIKGNKTSAFGTFNFAVPKNVPLRAEFLTNAVIGQVLAPLQLFGTISAPIDLGIVTLKTGFHVTGTVRRQNGVAVNGADVDAIDVATGDTLFTPNDNTNTLGVFDVVVPAGTIDLSVIRPTALVLVGVEVKNLFVNAPLDVGILTMRDGVFLSGNVRDGLGLPVLAADVNVTEAATGLPIALGSDNTNASGFYSVVVPTGLMHVVFSPPGPHTAFDKDRHRNVSVVGNTTLHGRLKGKDFSFGTQANPTPAGPIVALNVIVPFGVGTHGSGPSVPHIQGSLAPSGSGTSTTVPSALPSAPSANRGRDVTLRLFGGLPGAQAELLLGTEERALAAAPELHLVRPSARIPVRLDEQGSAQITLALEDLAPIGTKTFAQFMVIDPGARRGLALSHVLSLESPR